MATLLHLLSLFGFNKAKGLCNYHQQIQPNVTYYVYNPTFPFKYAKGSTCSWYATAPRGYRIRMACKTFNIPGSAACSVDRIVLATDSSKFSSDVYCGLGQITYVSQYETLYIGLEASKKSPGGKFLCTLTALAPVGTTITTTTTTTTTTTSPVTDPTARCSCGLRNVGRIVGGVNSGVNEYPMMAALIDRDTGEWFCGATIIDRYYLLTAAHCVADTSYENVAVLVGDWDLESSTDTMSELYDIQREIIHPGFDEDSYANDVALLRTTRPIEFNFRVSPICLPFLYDRSNFDGVTVTALGWGFTDFEGSRTSILQKVDLQITTDQFCRQYWPTRMDDTAICSYGVAKDSCVGDSGGPLLWQDDDSDSVQLLGIIDYGRQCGTNQPAVNMRVTAYLSWIIQNTPDATYCRRL